MSGGDDFVHGINKMKKPATKVMAPPGGKTSINLFGGPEEPVKHEVNKHQAHRNQSSIFGSPEQKAPPPANTTTAAATAAPASAPAPADKNISPSNEDAGNKGRPSTKVMAPPGGKTSINLFG